MNIEIMKHIKINPKDTLVVMDPKGEELPEFIKILKDNGYEIKIFKDKVSEYKDGNFKRV